MKNNQALQKKEREQTPLENSIEKWTLATVKQNLDRARDITRDKSRAVKSFFELIGMDADQVTSQDVLEWHQSLLDRNLSERYIYASLSHLSGYFEWLKKTELGRFLKINPVQAAMPKPPDKYNSAKLKALTDEELNKLWHYMEKQAQNDKNLIAVRDYAIFRLFMATGQRREEIINIGAEDIRLEENQIVLHTRVKGGTWEWRTVFDQEVRDAIERYLELTNRRLLIGKSGHALWTRFDRAAFFTRIKKKREAPSDDEPRMTSLSFDRQMKKYAHEAGIGHFHIHQFRHTFARIVAEESGSMTETQEALGHKDIQTTMIYVNRIKIKKDKHSQSVRNRITAANEIEGNDE